MAEKQFEKLRKLSPEERILKLRKLQEENKKEIEEAKQMITESRREIEITEELREIPIPQVKAVDIDSLFTGEEKEIYKTKRYISDGPQEEQETEKPLEETIQETAVKHTEEEAVIQYGSALERAKELTDMATKLANAYDTIKGLATQESLSGEDMQRLESYGEIAKALSSTDFRPPDAIYGALTGAEETLYSLGLRW